jgi:uncharacterized protein YdhG (YjbR/CyaY superfamily)
MEDVIEAYITKAPLEVQEMLRRVRQLVLEVDPELTQTLSYQMPTFKKHGKNIFHFAAQKNHLGIYPTPSAIEHFAGRLESYKTSKGAIQMPYTMPLDEDLIQDMVRFKLKELENG